MVPNVAAMMRKLMCASDHVSEGQIRRMRSGQYAADEGWLGAAGCFEGGQDTR